MFKLQDNCFFKPGKLSRNLSILQRLHENSYLTQKGLGEKVAMSSAMVNQYIKDLQELNLIFLESINGKQYVYQLTEQGEKERKKLQANYRAEIIRYYSKLKNEIRDKFTSLSQEKATALFGANDTCEMVLSILNHDISSKIVAIVDNKHENQGQNFHGYTVSPPEILLYLNFEILIFASFVQQEESRQQILSLQKDRDFEIIFI